MFYPVLAGLPCATCKKYVIDYDWDTHRGTGEITRWGKSPGLREKLQERVAGVPLPCDRCPKESPDKEHEHVLSNKNVQAYSHYLEVKASSGCCLSDAEREDRTLRRNLAIIDSIAREAEQYHLAKRIADRIPYMGGAGGV